MYKVLIVEDDPMVAMINEQYVHRNKLFQVIGKCTDGNNAIEFLESNTVDLIIMDVFMPYSDGLETLRQIRSRQIPADVIMVTAANERIALEEAMHLGAVDYLVKPFAFDRFQMALEKFIAHTDALKDINTLNQKNIDYIISNSHSKNETVYPKGIQRNTLTIIIDYLKESNGKWLTGEAIADKVDLSSVTVRRYLNYLIETGQIVCDMNYETGGRPCMLYRIEP